MKAIPTKYSVFPAELTQAGVSQVQFNAFTTDSQVD